MLPGLRQYALQAHDREPLVRFMLDRLPDAGCRIILASPPSRASFVISFEMRIGERTNDREWTSSTVLDEGKSHFGIAAKMSIACSGHGVPYAFDRVHDAGG